MDNNELMVAEHPETVHLAARNSQELDAAKASMVAWFCKKIAAITEELDTVSQAAKYAKEHKWNHAALDGQVTRIRKRREFYEKILEALNAGYTIVPDIPLDLFAIRIKRSSPRQNLAVTESSDNWTEPRTEKEKCEKLPVGAGGYVNPDVVGYRDPNEKLLVDGKEIIRKVFRVTDFAEMEFPIIAAHPVVMNATQQAMAMRVFDQIGVSPQRAKRGDPLVIGQIINKVGYSEIGKEEMVVHGLSGYTNNGCRCETCRMAMSDYNRSKYETKKIKPTLAAAEGDDEGVRILIAAAELYKEFIGKFLGMTFLEWLETGIDIRRSEIRNNKASR